VRLTLDESALAEVTFGGGHPEVYGLLPAAVAAATRGDFALLKRLVTASEVSRVRELFIDPSLFSAGAASATSCHDYPRPYDLSASPATRRAEYGAGLAALDPAAFRPFSAAAWLATGIDAGPKCLEWPADPTAGSPLGGHPFPDVPVLVQSGDLDSNTPIEQGRRAAAQFPHATFAVVANAGHTPDTHPCGVAMAIEFVEHLRTDPTRCRHVGRPPVVVERPALRADQLPAPGLHAAAPLRRALAVALATIADARSAATYSGLGGSLDALRGGTYVVGRGRVRFVGARVVSDAVADGVQTTHGSTTLTRLRLRGPGVEPARLTVRTVGSTTRVSGMVGGRRLNVTMVRARSERR
jgi:hypothetical protein